MRKRLKSFSFALATVVLLFSSKEFNAQDELLRKQISLYYFAWEKQDAKTMWELMSTSMKDGWHDDSTAFAAHSKTFFEGSRLVKSEIKDIKMTDSHMAIVQTEVSFELRDKKGTKKITDIDKTKWVFEEAGKKTWLFDGNIPAQ